MFELWIMSALIVAAVILTTYEPRTNRRLKPWNRY